MFEWSFAVHHVVGWVRGLNVHRTEELERGGCESACMQHWTTVGMAPGTSLRKNHSQIHPRSARGFRVPFHTNSTDFTPSWPCSQGLSQLGRLQRRCLGCFGPWSAATTCVPGPGVTLRPCFVRVWFCCPLGDLLHSVSTSHAGSQSQTCPGAVAMRRGCWSSWLFCPVRMTRVRSQTKSPATLSLLLVKARPPRPIIDAK